MSKATKLYDNKHSLYASFQQEKEQQQLAYEQFQKDLKKSNNYNARFLPKVDLTNGVPPKLTDNYQDRANGVNQYITEELNYDYLYTSGHWTGIIKSWIQMHAQLFDNKENFIKDFAVISNHITDADKYTDFVGKASYYLLQFGKDDFIEGIAPIVVSSGRITSYKGKTMQVYIKAMIGSQALDLVTTVLELDATYSSNLAVEAGTSYSLRFQYTGEYCYGATVDNVLITESIVTAEGNAFAFRLEDGTQGFGKVLTSDAFGNGYWAAISLPQLRPANADSQMLSVKNNSLLTSERNSLTSSSDNNDTLNNGSSDIIPAIVKAMQEQQTQIEDNKKEIIELRNIIHDLKSKKLIKKENI